MYFAGTRADLEPGLIKFEAEAPLKYVAKGFHVSPDPEVFRSALDIPEFGKNISLSYQWGKRMIEHSVRSAQTYIILPESIDFNVQAVPQAAGGILYMVDSVQPQSAIFFQPGGLMPNGALIGGYVVGLESRLEKILTKGFKRALDYARLSRVYRVGPEALSMMQSGGKLYTNENQPIVLPGNVFDPST